MFNDAMGITYESFMHEQDKIKRAARIANATKKKKQRMKFSQVKGYPNYPYYVKSDCILRKTTREVIPSHTVLKLVRTYDETTDRVVFHLEEVFCPSKVHKKVISSNSKSITPYLKQYCRTSARAPYKHLAVRKERYTKYDVAPSARSFYKRTAEVDWLAW